MTVESVLAHGLKTSVFGSQWNAEHGDNLALLDPDRIKSDLLANRPAFGAAHRFFFATDTQKLYYDTGAAWVESSAALASHAASHAGGGADPVTLAQSQVTNLAADLAGKEAANANIQAHIASAANPHGATAAQVGLGNADNTSDANKPVSTAQQAALNGKVNNTGAETIAGVKTFSTPGGVVAAGVTDGSSAAAGVVGEYVSAAVATDTALPAANNVWGDAASITLTAGDWDITLALMLTLNGATITNAAFGLGTVSGNSSTGISWGDTGSNCLPPSAAYDIGASIPAIRKALTATTTFYFKLVGTYSAGTPKYRCRISARRVR